MTSFDLPEEIMFQILLYLPVISLLRFKSVCKSWSSLIQSPKFITQHLHKSKNSLIFRMYPIFTFSPKWFTLLSGNDEFDFSQDFDVSEDFRNDNAIIIGSCCHGIICMHHSISRDVFLWNPATKESITLPDPIQEDCTTCIGFGFDARTNDYKVVRLITTYDEYDVAEETRVEVYNLRTDSWRMVDTDLPVYSLDTLYLDTPAYENGIHIWLRTNGEEIPWILSFDFKDEVIGTMSLPDTNGVRDSYLGFIGESITCITTSSKIEDGVYHVDIWVLKEYGVQESWVKQYTLGFFSALPKIARAILSNENFILFHFRDQLLLCDPVTQKMKNILQIHAGSTYEAVLYKESLVRMLELIG